MGSRLQDFVTPKSGLRLSRHRFRFLRDPVPVAGVDLDDTSRLWDLDVEGAAPSGGLGKVGGREPGVDAPSAL